MSVLYVHFSWFFFLFFIFFNSLVITLYLVYFSEVLSLSFSFLSLGLHPLSVSFSFDSVSITFMTVVLMISTVIMIYSFNYLSPYSNPGYFLWTTFLFIASMLILVSMSNLFFLILGWDGLGLVSFLLIIYYQNQSSITSGLFTLIMNRLGDCFFLITIGLFAYNFSSFSFSASIFSPLICSFFLVITFITNSAIYPFSPWLPLAMAAPTPISALVHSSTLVTAGLFLMMRFSYYIFTSIVLVKVLLVLCLFTSFYAGMNAVFEVDLKKLIALSTLSHLGFIGLAFSAGLVSLAFFHLLTHALFKSLLFMAMGDVIININHSQDSRYLSLGYFIAPASSAVMLVSIVNLLGLPSLSGFFSNDLVLETLNYSLLSYTALLIVFLNVLFTYFYTYQLFRFSFHSSKLLPYQNHHSVVLSHSVLLWVIAVSTLLFGAYYLLAINTSIIFVPVPLTVNLAPLSLNISMFLILLLFTNYAYPNYPSLVYYFNHMIGLSSLSLSVASFSYFSLATYWSRSLETGALNVFLNTNFSILHSRFSDLSIASSSVAGLNACFYFSSFFVFLSLLSL